MDVRAILKAKGGEVATVPPDTTIAAAVATLTERMIGALVVTDENGALVGIVSERDVVRGLAEQGAAFLDCRIETCMASPVEDLRARRQRPGDPRADDRPAVPASCRWSRTAG